MPRLTTFLLFLTVSVPAPAEEPDPIADVLDAAKFAYVTSLDNAKDEVTAKFDELLKAVSAEGKLNPVLAVKKERDAFVQEGKLSTSPTLKPTMEAYVEKVNQARQELAKAYAKAVADYTKALKVDEAKQLRAEYDVFAKEGRVVIAGQEVGPNPAELAGILTSRLVGTKWTWDKLKFTFNADGTLTREDNANLLWTAIDGSRVLAVNEDNRNWSVLTFNENLTGYTIKSLGSPKRGFWTAGRRLK